MIDLKKNIKAHGWTISRLAEAIKITQPSLSKQLSEGTPSLIRLQEIANAIGISVSELVNEEQASSSGVVCPKCGARLKLVETDND